jgi:hypothetical protein
MFVENEHAVGLKFMRPKIARQEIVHGLVELSLQEKTDGSKGKTPGVFLLPHADFDVIRNLQQRVQVA